MTMTARTAAGPVFSFDGQARGFDRRAGLPPAAAEAVARAVAELAVEANPVAGGVVLDLGAGTGEIGVQLAAGERLAYLGIDLSPAMLAAFRTKLHRSARGARGSDAADATDAADAASPAALVAADADRPWPLLAGRVRAIFLSRAAHLLDPERLLAEASRAAHPAGALLILGRVRREPDSLRATLRREMRRLLAERGVPGRSGEEARRRLLALAAERGLRPLPPQEAASWEVAERAADSLAAWRATPGLAGTPVAPAVRRDLLDRLAAWAEERYGALDAVREATERYELTAVRLR
jgi:SAM-dependent methyltransferase